MTAHAQTLERPVGGALVQLLKDYGVDTVFGIPGVHNNELYRGLLNSGLRHVLPRHEQGAGFMADGYARATGRPAVCFTITGPGLANIMTPLGQAYSDSVPLLTISSALDLKDLGQGFGRLHEITDQRAAACTVTGFAATATSPAAVPQLVARAFNSFHSARPRPAYVEIPIDVLAAPASGDWRARALGALPDPEAAAVEEAARLLSEAERPMVVVGGGAIGASAPLRKLVKRLGAASLPTIAGKGVIPDSDPLCTGANLVAPEARDFLASADVVLAIGTELAETDHYSAGLTFGGALIRVDLDPHKLADRYPADVAILADAKAVACAILDALPKGGAVRSKITADEVADLARAITASEDPAWAFRRGVLKEIRSALPDDAIVATDMTQLAYGGNQAFPVEQPRSWLHPVGFGTLGYGLPVAIGAKIGRPDRPVVAIAGDYGFQYTLNELAVAAELELPLVVILWNSQSLGAIIDDMDRKGIGHIATHPRNPDFQMLAKAYGCRPFQVTTMAGIGESLAAALTHQGPSLVEIDAGSL
ncbi:MAG: 5-guanidino-2-oxopentanoate decarboxylase [Pseudomonadota bacterium]